MLPEESIFEADLGEGDQAFAVMLPVDPHGESLFAAPDNSPASMALLQELCSYWTVLWPKILEKLEEGIADYEVEVGLDEDEFIGEVSRIQKGEYMAGQADIFLRLEFDDPPLWDAFIKGDELVHFQAVF
jgi:hypothetical protein